MGRRAKMWQIREDYRSLLIKAKKLFPTVLGHIRIKRVALIGLYHRRNNFIAKIYPNRQPWGQFIPDYDYLVAFWSSRFDDKPLSYKIYVVIHELQHIPYDGFMIGSRSYRRTIHHDIEDFEFLRKAYGISLENVHDVLKGEKHLMDPDAIRRFPRTERIH